MKRLVPLIIGLLMTVHLGVLPAEAATTDQAPFDYSEYCGPITAPYEVSVSGLINQGCSRFDGTEPDATLQPHARDGHLLLCTEPDLIQSSPDCGTYESRVGVNFTPSASQSTTVTAKVTGLTLAAVNESISFCLVVGGIEITGVHYVDCTTPSLGAGTLSVNIPAGFPQTTAEVTLFDGDSSVPAGPIRVDVTSISLS
ncbi:MAG: hypothetical protein ACYDCC_13010 [Actinomycetota bacterium]